MASVEQTAAKSTAEKPTVPAVPATGDSAAPTDAAPPVKRGRGRPKGSKNKKTVDAATGEVIPRKKRARTVKEKQDDDEDDDEPLPKKKRGPPTARTTPAQNDDGTQKKKRGRPAGTKKAEADAPVLAGEVPAATTSAAAQIA